MRPSLLVTLVSQTWRSCEILACQRKSCSREAEFSPPLIQLFTKSCENWRFSTPESFQGFSFSLCLSLSSWERKFGSGLKMRERLSGSLPTLASFLPSRISLLGSGISFQVYLSSSGCAKMRSRRAWSRGERPVGLSRSALT